jgi:starch phosphorylase
VIGIPYDTPVAGYGNDTVNTLRLWEAHADAELDLQVFNEGDYVHAVEEKTQSEVISKVLYPNDNHQTGRDLRLKQHYFFVACAIHDVVRRYLKHHGTFDAFADKNAIQLNDTHPSIAVAELMRVLVDDHGVAWDEAWEIVNASLGYTNHTLLGEALERWPVTMFERLLPRHLQIIYEINRRFLSSVAARYPGDVGRVQRLSLVEETSEKKVRMAHLAVVGSHSVNGVAQLHTELLKKEVFPDFVELFPERFSNKTNGVTPRRWLLQCNPRLAKAITQAIGSGWTRDLDRLELLLPLAEDAAFVEQIGAIKLANKKDFAAYARERHGLALDPSSLFDVQVKRLHEYKRQLLNALHAVRLYLDARSDPAAVTVPRTILFAAKAAPGYRTAKLIIKLINSIAATVNGDARVAACLKVAFLPDYKVSLAERIMPASDLSEQISTAGKEASGTGNMKFAMNGALIIGTLDGANVEIRDAVGAENFFLFGLTAEQVAQRKSTGYVPGRIYEENADLREVLDAIASGMFEPGNKTLFQPLVDSLLDADPYMLLADYASYVACQEKVGEAFRDPSAWHAMAVKNIASMGAFSSDRTVRDYARDIWRAHPVDFTLEPYEAR